MTRSLPTRDDVPRPGRRRWAAPTLLAAVVLFVPAAASATTASAAPAARAASHHVVGGPKPTVVLVHGAFADASSWNGVTRRLQREGYTVVAAANPLRDLAGDAAYVSSVLDGITGPVVLVGHSYGGEVITNAAVGHPNVKALVYVAAFAPDAGESALELTGRFPGSRLGAHLAVRSFPEGDGTTGTEATVDPAAFRAVFAADVPAGTSAVMASAQRPVALAALAAPSGTPAWETIPSWYLVAGSDQAIPAAAERFMAQRAGAHTVEIKGASHVVMVSHPARTADLVVRAADATS
jgi:pimeloyl-ACP methyl ester carboxylesterase